MQIYVLERQVHINLIKVLTSPAAKKLIAFVFFLFLN